MRYLFGLVPLLVLLAASALACVLGYFFIPLLGDVSPQKVISKTTQVLLVLSIFPAMAYLKLTRQDLGFADKSMFLKQVGLGFGLGLITLLPMFILLYSLDVMVIDETQVWTIAKIAEKTVIALLLALLISLLEEPMFRGVLLVSLGRKMPMLTAVLISAFYYAVLHFIKSPTDIPASELTLMSSFQLLGYAFANLLNPEILSALFALLMVGIFLGILRTQVPTSLGLCIGCHTCWVWQIKMSKTLFNTDFNADYAFLVSHYDGVIGSLVAGWLLLAILVYFAYRMRLAHSSAP
jgi:membrane protease YdiL (CAAX protease family)